MKKVLLLGLTDSPKTLEEHVRAAGCSPLTTESIDCITDDLTAVLVSPALEAWPEAVARAGGLGLPVYVLATPSLDLYVQLRDLLGQDPGAPAYGVVDPSDPEELPGLLKLIHSTSNATSNALVGDSPNLLPVLPEPADKSGDIGHAVEGVGEPEEGDRDKRQRPALEGLLRRFRGREDEVTIDQTEAPEGSHRILTVWNPSGAFKTWTALNLAVAAAARGGYDVALVNLDLVCPELDAWFGIKQTTVERRKGNLTHGVGLMTFGEALPIEIVPKMLQEYGWGIKYLPAGNKLGNIGTPDFELGTIERAIEAVAGRDTSRPALTIVNAAACFELPCSYGALKAADVILIPTTDAPQEAEVVTQQISELRRVGVDSKIIEILWTLGNGKREPVWPGIERIVITRDDAGYVASAIKKTPLAATDEGVTVWAKVMEELVRRAE